MVADPVIIALDAMGGDNGPKVVLPAALDVLEQDSRVRFIVYGDKEKIFAVLTQHHALYSKHKDRIEVVHTSQEVSMDDSPALALRSKKDSSMRQALNAVKRHEAHACVSAGNTGALMAISRFVLKTLPGIDRPAIVYSIPVQGYETDNHVYVLDLGANVDCDSEHLFQFAVMGSVLAQGLDKNDMPKVALLNIGSEEIKGTDQIKQASVLLTEAKEINYIGYIEGDKVFKGLADVVVCDGFVGNIFLKSVEGTAKLVIDTLREGFKASLKGKIIGLIAKPFIKQALSRLEPARHNGACFVGLQGIVIKSHGNSTRFGFSTAIYKAIAAVEYNIPEKIRVKVEILLGHP